jgi:peroxiredoxin
MAQLRQGYQKFIQKETEIIVIGPDNADDFKKYWKKEKLQFIGLPDPKNRVLKLYGQEVKIFKLGRLPAQMLVDKSGTLHYVHYGHSMADIPSNKELLKLVDSLKSLKN